MQYPGTKINMALFILQIIFFVFYLLKYAIHIFFMNLIIEEK